MSVTLRIFIKQSQEYDPVTFNPTWYQGANPMNLSPTQTLQTSRRWNNWNGSNVPQYIEVTDWVSNLHKLKLTWSTERDANGFPVVGSIQPRKSSSGELQFEREAFFLLKQWLYTDVSAPLNSVDVKIEHVGCGTYENYIITANELNFCDDQALCVFNISIKGKDSVLQCIQKTLIADNWQGWFPEDGQSFQGGKKHPRFSYCNEIRPNGQLVVSWYFMSLTTMIIYLFFFTVVIPIMAVIGFIIWVINIIIAALNSIPGVNINPINNFAFQVIANVFNGNFTTAIGSFFIEAAGCGREHPAPLVRDYISNVCSKCGVVVDATTAPIFFSNSFNNITSNRNRNANGGYITVDNPHYNACYFYAPMQRGIRRFDSISLLGYANPNTTNYWISENQPQLDLDMFLDQIKILYNAEWMLKSINIGGQLIPHLYFQRKDFYRNPTGQYIFDFSKMGADRHKIIEGACYNWNGRDGFTNAFGLYDQDSVDTCGNEAGTQMNDFVNFGTRQNNPTLKGLMDKKTHFGATKFRLDGASTDYIMDAFQVNVNGSWLSLFTGLTMFGIVKGELETYADYCLLLKDESCSLPKIIIWDGQEYDNAKAIKAKQAAVIQGNPITAFSEPEINPSYNNYGGAKRWFVKHIPRTFVKGGSLVLTTHPFGFYTAADTLGAFLYEKPALLVNYPMYFAPGFYDGMWDWFHFLDDPVNNPTLNMDWKVRISLCCEDLQRLKLFKDGSEAELIKLCKLDNVFYTDGKITEITVDYDPTSERGAAIEIKGQV